MHEVQRHAPGYTRVETPADLDGVIALLSDAGPSARLVAGGTDLLLELDRGVRPDVGMLVDITRIPDLDRIEVDGPTVRIGALVTHNRIVASDLIRAAALPLAQACREIGSPQLRNRATVVGNLVTASPANDTITPLRVLDAAMEIRSGTGTRTVPLADFHTGLRTTSLAPDEIVTGVRFTPIGPDDLAVFLKLGNRRAQAISVVHLTAKVTMAGDEVVDARLAIGSVATTIVEPDVSRLVGTALDDGSIDLVASEVGEALTPIDDVRATADYRVDQIPVMIRRAFRALRNGPPATLPPDPVTLSTSSSTSPSGGHVHDPSTPVVATVNGAEVSAPATVPATLLDWLRDQAGLTGTKEGCAEGECGACTVFLGGDAVMSCLVPASAAHGSEVVTIEGLAGAGTLHPMQQAFIDATAVQCGFCIPGFVMAAAKLIEERPRPTTDEIVGALEGNLCRCTGYYPIIEAVHRVGRGDVDVDR